MRKKMKLYALLIMLCAFSTITQVKATTVYVTEETTKSVIYGWFVNDNYDKIILNSDLKVDCFSDTYSINSIKDSSKTLDLNGHYLNLGDKCDILINGITGTNSIVNIIDSSKEKNGTITNSIKIRNCTNNLCNKLTVNINGGNYNSSTFIKFATNDIGGINDDKMYAKDLTLNISNIRFSGNLLFQDYSSNIFFKNAFLKNKLNFMNADTSVKLSDVISEGFKLTGSNGDIDMNSLVNNLNVDSNYYIAKNVDLINIDDFSIKYLGYDNVEDLNIKLENNTEKDIVIDNITIDNNDDFILTTGSQSEVKAGSNIVSDYKITPKLGLKVGIYNTNVIATDSDGNIYVKNIKFNVENRKIQKPSISSNLSFDYDGENHEITFNDFDENAMEIVGTTKENQVGDYSFTIKLKEGYSWQDGSTDDISYNWKIILVTEINGLKISGRSTISVNNNYQYFAKVNPENATYKDVTWSVENGTGSATIDQNGLLSTTKTGTIVIKIVSKRDISIYTEKIVKVVDENSPRIIVTAPNYYLDKSQKYQLNADIVNINLDGSNNLSWSSSDTSIATIDQNGLLTPKKTGVVSVKVSLTTDSSVYENIDFLIYDSDTTIVGNIGDSLRIDIESSVKCTNYEWIYSDRTLFESIVGGGRNLSTTPYLYYLWSLKPQKEGYSTIELKCSNTVLGKKEVYTYNSVKNITSKYNEIIMEINDNINIDVQPWMENVTDELNGVYYKIDNEKIAKVDLNGNIQALEKGNTNLTILSKYNNQKLIIPLSVVEDKNDYTILSESVSVSGETTNLRVGKQFQYVATIIPTNTSDKSVTWSVENGTGSATIDQNGLLTAVSAGNVIVKAVTNDGTNLVGTLNVTLKDYIDVENISLKAKNIYMDMGKSLYMEAIIYPENATIKKVKWSSSDTSIATIDPDTGGLSTNYKKGDVTIKATATDGSGVVGTILLHVGYTNVKVGEIVSVSNSSYVTYEDVIWNITDENILGQTGEKGYTRLNNYYRHYIKVKGLKNGKTNVTMKTISGSELASSIVYVYTPVSKLTSDLKEIMLSKSETKKINVTIKPDDVTSGLDTLIYTSSDSSIVKVDQNGNITGMKNGNANVIIYSQYNDISLTIPVTVNTYSESLVLDTEKLNLNNNIKEHQIKYEVLPKDAINKNVIFSSEDTSIATVSNSGLITAVRNGTTKIIVKTEDGRQTKEIVVTVSGMEKDINLNKIDEINNVIYNGEEQTPKINMYDGKYKLKENIDYEVTYQNNKNAGLAIVNLKGIGNFKGTKTINFTIEKAGIEYSASGITKTYDGNEYGIDLSVTTPNVKIMYADNNGNYTLTTMPKYKNAGIYEIKFQLSIDSNYKVVLGSSTVIIKKAPFEIDYNSNDNTVSYDGNEYGIDLGVITPNAKVMYADNNGNYTLTTMPKYKNAGTYKIKYQITIDDNHVATFGENTLIINKGNYKNNTKDKYVHFDGNDHSIDLDINTREYSAKYSIGNDLSYNLSNLPKFNKVGQYKINYRLFSDNYNDYTYQNLLTIYGISGFDSTLKLNNSILSIRDYNNKFSSLYTKISFLANTSVWKHLDLSGKEINNETIKTGDFVQLIINNEKTYQYQLSVLGDVNSDGKISALDYVKIKNHIMKTSIIDNDVNLLSADLNEDGKISALDYVRIKNYIMNGGK